MLAPSSRARDLLAGRRALQRGTDAEVIAVGPSIPLSRRTNMGVPVAVRANLRLALTHGRFDVVHGFEPGLPSLSYLALTSTHALIAATFFSVDRLAYPARRSRRDRLRTRIDALLATSEETAREAAERFEGDYGVIPLGVDLGLFRPSAEAPAPLDRARSGRALHDTRTAPSPRRRAGVGGGPPAHEAARLPTGDPATTAAARARSRHPHDCAARRRARAGGDLRLRAGR